MKKMIETAEQAKQDQAYYSALKELLYQFADDDLIISFRGSEWLGLAPFIEEDVAFSSITQNTMGHATMFFQMLEELGEGDADHLVHARPTNERRSSAYLEKKNGTGHYIAEPDYDWALAVVRNFLYETMKRVKLQAATKSTYKPLANMAAKILMEQTYHVAHWKLWMEQLLDATEEAKEKMTFRLDEAWAEFGDALSYGSKAQEMKQLGIIVAEETFQQSWLEEVKKTVPEIYHSIPKKSLGNGREGTHTEDLQQAIDIFTEVYQTDEQAVW